MKIYGYFCKINLLMEKRMKKLYIISLFLLTIAIGQPSYLSARQEWQLSPYAYASVLTCGPGNEFYETFGHSALRICDTASGIDYVFNYGTFDFDEPHFYLKFFRGRLNYFLAIQTYDNFIFEYNYYGRAVWEQRLNISSEVCSQLFDLLMENALPENKYYKYDFFRDNCATRIDDMVARCVPQSDRQSATLRTNSTSYRDLLYKYNKSMPWWQLGTDILLGARCDRSLDMRQFRFIPMEMMWQYDTLLMANGNLMTDEYKQVLSDNRTPMNKGISPTLVMWLVFAFVLFLSLFAEIRGWKLYWFDALIYFLASVLSLLLLFMWFGSDHWCTKWNMNLLWANPLLIWPLLQLRKPRNFDSLPMIAILLVLIVGWMLWPQHLNAAVLPIVLIILMRLSIRLNRSARRHK